MWAYYALGPEFSQSQLRGSLAGAELTLPYSRFAYEYEAVLGKSFFRQTRAGFEKLIKRYRITFRSAADIGCGTGLFARYLNRSWQVPVIGVDMSPEKLRVAAGNCGGMNVSLLRQDIRSLRLPRPVDLITCNFDTLNHLIGDDDLLKAFRAVHRHLRPGGHFIFDMIMKCSSQGGVNQYIRRFNSATRVVTQQVRWEPFRRLLLIVVSICMKNGSRPFTEVHRERIYSTGEIGRGLSEAGFTNRGVHDAITLASAERCPLRITVVAMKR